MGIRNYIALTAAGLAVAGFSLCNLNAELERKRDFGRDLLHEFENKRISGAVAIQRLDEYNSERGPYFLGSGFCCLAALGVAGYSLRKTFLRR